LSGTKRGRKKTPPPDPQLSAISTEPVRFLEHPIVTPAQTGEFTPVLICIEGPQRGQRFPIQKTETVIGRSSSVEVPISDGMASRRHARITYRNLEERTATPECFVEDLGSRNGTELNGLIVQGPSPLRERDRVLIGSTVFGVFFRDQEELQIDKSLYEQATCDPLTGLANRPQLRKHLLHQIERCNHHGGKLSMLIIDVDNLKATNDTLGHDVGDQVLIHLAKVISTGLRPLDVCARWGGDEFALLLPETGSRTARSIASRLQANVRAAPYRASSKSIPLSVSIGGAMLTPGDNPDSFFHRADQQLLRAKELGDNQLVFSLGKVIDSSSMRRNEQKPS
jgi:two-component system, cell cycle response regulator